MDPAPKTVEALAPSLPALRYDARGRRRIDYRAVIALAVPLFLNSGIQAILNLTDTWFLGRISTHATAAVGAVYWFVIVFVLIFGGVSMAVQTLVAQAYGAGERRRAAESTWAGIWLTLAIAPLLLVIALSGPWLIAPFRLQPAIETLALQFWFPRLLGATAGIALWTIASFFNGIGRTKATFFMMAVAAAVNDVLNEVFIFHLGLGVAGSAWATGAAQLIGFAVGLSFFLSRGTCREFLANTCWRPDLGEMRRVLALGLPMGMLPAVDLIGLALFQAMQVSLGAVGGAATQIVMMMTSIAYMPAVGIASVGTTLVGQSIGAGDRAWAVRTGNAAIKLNVGYMGLVSFVLALGGPWFLPLFVSATDPNAQSVIALGRTLLWIAAAYQIFDGVNLGAGFCLRGAGDVRVPTLLVMLVSWFGFVPLTHFVTFDSGNAWVQGLPQLGWGTEGGWGALLLYTMALGAIMLLRWRSGAWRKISLA